MPSKTEKGHSGKCKRNYAGHSSDAPAGAKKTRLLHVPGNSPEENKLLKEYTKKRSEKHTYKDKESRSGGNNKRTKTVKFGGATQEVNTMKYHDEPTPKNKKKKRRRKSLIVIRPM